MSCELLARSPPAGVSGVVPASQSGSPSGPAAGHVWGLPEALAVLSPPPAGCHVLEITVPSSGREKIYSGPQVVTVNLCVRNVNKMLQRLWENGLAKPQIVPESALKPSSSSPRYILQRTENIQFSSVQFSCSVVSDSL